MKNRATQIVSTSHAPAAIGPYSQAVKAGNLVFLSGQIPLDPWTGSMVNSDIEAETHQVMRNLSAVLEAAQSSFNHVVRTTIYLINLDDFAKVNQIYASYFSSDPPARVTVQVAALPRGARVEIDCIALLPSNE